MEMPLDVEVHTSPTTEWWIDKDGIICVNVKEHVFHDTTEDQQKRLEEFDRIWGDKKACVLMDVSHVRPEEHSKTFKLRSAEIFNRKAKALAVIAPKLFDKTMVDVFFNLTPPRYDVRFFTDEKSARDWLKQICP